VVARVHVSSRWLDDASGAVVVRGDGGRAAPLQRCSGPLSGGVRVQVAQRQRVGHMRRGQSDGRTEAPGLRYAAARPDRQPAVPAGQGRVRGRRTTQLAEAVPVPVPAEGTRPVRVSQAQQPGRAGLESQQHTGGAVHRVGVRARAPRTAAQRQSDHEGSERRVRSRAQTGPAGRVRVPDRAARVHSVLGAGEHAGVAQAGQQSAARTETVHGGVADPVARRAAQRQPVELLVQAAATPRVDVPPERAVRHATGVQDPDPTGQSDVEQARTGRFRV